MLLADDDNMKFQKMVHFWLPCILLFYQMCDFLYLGFNEDEAHRKVFDAVQIVIPGTQVASLPFFSSPTLPGRQMCGQQVPGRATAGWPTS